MIAQAPVRRDGLDVNVNDLVAIGARIREARTAKKLSQNKLAALVESTGESISRYELGKMEASVTVLTRLADVLGVDFEWLRRRARPCKRVGPPGSRGAAVLDAGGRGPPTPRETAAQ